MEIYIIYAIIILWICHRLKVIKFSHFKIPDKTIQQIIGDIGEKKVAKELKKLNDEYIIENSIDTEYGIRLSGLQIDHIVRHPK
ncbi:MAG: hypothetical protein K0S41_3271, partial [Anaerocolumna sp.]|nr:hypothetical protein [Anaerocolumna sp.]